MDSALYRSRPLSIAWSVSEADGDGVFDAYRNAMVDLYDIQDALRTPRRPFWNRTLTYRMGSSIFGRGNSSGQTFDRDAARIRRSGLDHVSVVVNMTSGAGDFDGASATTGHGSVQFRDLSRPSRSRTDEVDILTLMTPRDAAPGWLLGRSFHGLTLDPDSAGGRLVGSHMGTLFAVADRITEDQAVAAVEATFVIAERFMGGDSHPTPMQSDAIQRTIRRRAMQMFETGLAQGAAPDVVGVAQAIGVSRSSLYRAFADMGGVQTYLRHRRLDRLHAALRSGEAGPSTLADIVQANGFASVAVFEREFRARFGFPPGDVAPAAPVRATYDATGPTRLDRPGHDIFVDWLRVGEPS